MNKYITSNESRCDCSSKVATLPLDPRVLKRKLENSVVLSVEAGVAIFRHSVIIHVVPLRFDTVTLEAHFPFNTTRPWVGEGTNEPARSQHLFVVFAHHLNNRQIKQIYTENETQRAKCRETGS